MRIARIRHLFYPDLPQDYFFELSAWQARQGHDVHVLTWNKENNTSQNLVHEGVMIHRLTGFNLFFKGSFQDYPYLPRLPHELEALHPDIIHAESHLFLPIFQAIMKARKLDLPSVLTVHGVYAERGFSVNLFQKAYIRTLGFELFRKTDLIICLTKSDIAEIINLGAPSEKIRLVHNGVDTEFFKPDDFREDNLVVWVGRFVNEKGVEYLIRAAKLVTEKFKEVRFLLIGYGPLKLRMMKLAADIGIPQNCIRFTETLGRKDIASILSRSSIFVFPSLKEGMPLALLEAMASGNAIVASEIPGVTEIIQNYHNGLLILPRDPEAIASAILILVKDKGLKNKLSINARKTVEENFSFNSMLTNLDKVYSEARRMHK